MLCAYSDDPFWEEESRREHKEDMLETGTIDLKRQSVTRRPKGEMDKANTAKLTSDSYVAAGTFLFVGALVLRTVPSEQTQYECGFGPDCRSGYRDPNGH